MPFPHHWSSRARLLNPGTNDSDASLTPFRPRAEQYRGKNPGCLPGLQCASVFPFVLPRSCQEVFAQSVQWAHSHLGYYLCKQPQRLQGIPSWPTLIWSCCLAQGLSQRYLKYACKHFGGTRRSKSSGGRLHLHTVDKVRKLITDGCWTVSWADVSGRLAVFFHGYGRVVFKLPN